LELVWFHLDHRNHGSNYTTRRWSEQETEEEVSSRDRRAGIRGFLQSRGSGDTESSYVERAKNAPKREKRKIIADARKSLVIPEIDASDYIYDLTSVTIRKIERIYTDALRTIEIYTLLKKRDEEDDDDFMLML
jgi:galactokinase